MLIDAQNNASGFETCCANPDWTYATQPVIVGPDQPQIIGNNNSNQISITASV